MNIEMEQPVVVAQAKPKYEVADIFRNFADLYAVEQPLSSMQRKVIGAIKACRTAVLGGHVDECGDCGLLRISYNSCRNRHCPKCQGLKKEQWVEDRLKELLPVRYFHEVFTLPHALHEIVAGNERIIYGLLFKAASETLQHFGANFLKGRLAITAVLHTWGQRMRRHIHVHCIVSGGALSFNGDRWFSSLPDYLFDVKRLSLMFRDKYCSLLETAHMNGDLRISDETAFIALLSKIREQDWVVYSQPPFSGPEDVVRYIGRYTHRVAISNHRIVNIEGNLVTFVYRDYRDEGKMKEETVNALEFIGRFLLHTLPKGFARIRHYGILAGRKRTEYIQKTLAIFDRPEIVQAFEDETWDEKLLRMFGVDIRICPSCGHATMKHHRELLRHRGPTFHGEPYAQAA